MTTDIKQTVKEKYGEAALRVQADGEFLLRDRRRGERLLRSDHIESV